MTKGELGGGSDHNWLTLDLSDQFVKKRRIVNGPVKKDKWNISEDQDWTGFQEHIARSIPTLVSGDVDLLASSISISILNALRDEIGCTLKLLQREGHRIFRQSWFKN